MTHGDAIEDWHKYLKYTEKSQTSVYTATLMSLQSKLFIFFLKEKIKKYFL